LASRSAMQHFRRVLLGWVQHIRAPRPRFSNREALCVLLVLRAPTITIGGHWDLSAGWLCCQHRTFQFTEGEVEAVNEV
jgi:hypothetical protein